jgi:hypothetical protein
VAALADQEWPAAPGPRAIVGAPVVVLTVAVALVAVPDGPARRLRAEDGVRSRITPSLWPLRPTRPVVSFRIVLGAGHYVFRLSRAGMTGITLDPTALRAKNLRGRIGIWSSSRSRPQLPQSSRR